MGELVKNRGFLSFLIVFTLVAGPVRAFAYHREGITEEVSRTVEGKESVAEGYSPEIDPVTDDRIDKIEKKLEAFEAATVTKEEAAGHIYNYFKGFEFRFGMTGVMQGSYNNDKNGPQGDSLDASGTADIIIARQFFKNGLGLVHLEGGVGNGLNQNPIFSLLLFGTVDGDARPQAARVEIAEAYYEGSYFEGAFTFDIGRLDPTVYFDTNIIADDETTLFLNRGFVNNTAIQFPLYSFGATTAVTPCDWFYVSAGVFDASASGYEIETNIFWIAELGFTPTIGDLAGHYRFELWQNRAPHTDIFNGRTNDYGMGVDASFDQELTKWFVLFARGGYQSPSIYATKMAFSGGFALLGDLYGRKDDRLSIGYGVAINNDDFSPGRNEHVIEAYYRLAVGNGHVGLSPDVQFIINPGGLPASHNVVVVGLRAQVDF